MNKKQRKKEIEEKLILYIEENENAENKIIKDQKKSEQSEINKG